LLNKHYYTAHILRLPLDQWPDGVNRAFEHINYPLYLNIQGPSEFGIVGDAKLQGWDRSSDLPKIKVPTLVIGAKYDTMDPAHMEWMSTQFPNGEYYLTPSTRNIETEFADTVQRQETLDCENSGYDTYVCPSDDERGIYAAYLAVNGNKSEFFRKNGHLAVVFLSDEDVRGFGTSIDQYPHRLPEALDYPENLLNVIEAKLGKNTDVSAHAIVASTLSCVGDQRGQGGNANIHGALGSFYMSMTDPLNQSLIDGTPGVNMASFAGGQLVQGTIGSVCAADYVSELGSIKNVLSKTKSSERLKCALITGDDIDVRIDSGYEWKLNSTRDEITFTPALPPGKSFKLEYECI